MDQGNSEFGKQFGGSAAANGITGLILLLLYGLNKMCKQRRCKSKLHTCCLDVEISDKTIRSKPDIEAPRQGLGSFAPQRQREAQREAQTPTPTLGTPSAPLRPRTPGPKTPSTLTAIEPPSPAFVRI